VEDAQIERWHIVDFGEVMEKGMTSRSEAFFVEDGTPHFHRANIPGMHCYKR
jgi:hypothetical protein